MSLQVLEMHWKSSAEAKQQNAFTEDPSSVADGGLALTMMSLPVWVDIPLHQDIKAAPAEEQRANPSIETLNLYAEDGRQHLEDDLMVRDEDSQRSFSHNFTDAASGTL